MKTNSMVKVVGAGVLALASAGALPAREPKPDDMLARMFSGRSMMEGAELEAAIAKAAAHPLGSAENPVRVSQPVGERAYLARLRCADLKAPGFRRLGSAGVSPYGNIVDIYEVKCDGGDPAPRQVYMDMYHPGDIDNPPLEGFGMVGGRREPAKD